MKAIELIGVSKEYKTFTLDNISFSIETGTIMGLVGANGAGKSTIIKLIMDAIKKDSGTIKVFGDDNTKEEFIDAKQDIGIVLDEAHFPVQFDVKDINKIMSMTYKNWEEKTYFDYIKKFKIDVDKKIEDYSRGMKMKLQIAVALSHRAKLLILDEATGGLDALSRDSILDIFSEFTRDENNTVLISSHIISDLEKICDYITFIHEGKLIMSEEKDILLEKYGIIKVTEKELSDIPSEAIINKKKTSFGYEVLADKDKVNSSFKFEITSLETIILFMSKGE